MKNASLILGLVVSTFAAQAVRAADWPQWRGPGRNGISAEKLEGTEVKKLWTAQLGTGFAAFTVADGRVFTTGHADGKDTVFCLDAVNGKELWRHSYKAELGDKYYEGGTSAGPVVDGDRAYHASRWGDLICYEAASGKVVWQKNFLEETEAEVPEWGFSGSVLVQGGRLLLNIGKNGAAFDKADGKLVWKSEADTAGYSTPHLITVNGREQLVLSTRRAYKGVDPQNGAVLWEHTWNTSYGVNAADPILSGTRLFISSGYNKGCALLDLASVEPQEIWRNRVMRNQFNSSVLIDGHLYGCDGDENKEASLKCVELATGTEKWSEPGAGFCSLMAADGKLVIMTAKGELIIAKANAAKFEPISRTPVLTGRCWTVPVLANGRVYVRNSAGDAVCLEVK